MREIETILQNFPNSDRENLLPILQDVQQQIGYISQEAVVLVSDHLKIPTSKVYAVSTFYDHFKFVPGAKYKIRLCNGTACHMEGAFSMVKTFEKLLGIRVGQLSKNRIFSIETTPCMGACGKAPVIKINNTFYTDVTAEMASELIASIKEQERI